MDGPCQAHCVLDARLPLHTGRTESHSWNWSMEFDVINGVYMGLYDWSVGFDEWGMEFSNLRYGT